MFQGLSATGINREVAFTVESANQCVKQKVRCVAIPRAAVMKMADQIAELAVLDDEGEKDREEDSECNPSSRTIARGILPTLRHIVREEQGNIMDEATKDVEPDCNINTLGTKGAIDPNGSNFICMICEAELYNLYCRCEGCEKILDKDYNICFRCYSNQQYMYDMDMGFDKDNDKSKIIWTSNRHHTLRAGRECSQQKCKERQCSQCKQCWRCSCMCHGIFKVHRRSYGTKRVNELIIKCKLHANNNEVPFAEATQKRLEGEKMTIWESVKVPSPYYPTAERVKIARPRQAK